MSESTKDRLAKALRGAGAPDLATRAEAGEFSDFQSQHAMPKVRLVELLVGRGLRSLAEKVTHGLFDDTKAEAEEWWQREGKYLARNMGGSGKSV